MHRTPFHDFQGRHGGRRIGSGVRKQLTRDVSGGCRVAFLRVVVQGTSGWTWRCSCSGPLLRSLVRACTRCSSRGKALEVQLLEGLCRRSFCECVIVIHCQVLEADSSPSEMKTKDQLLDAVAQITTWSTTQSLQSKKKNTPVVTTRRKENMFRSFLLDG